MQTLPGAETHPNSQRVREQVAWSQPYSCYWLKLTWVPPLRTWAQLLVQRPGRQPLLAQGFARLAESHGNMGTQDQSTEHKYLGLTPSWFPSSTQMSAYGRWPHSQPAEMDRLMSASAGPADRCRPGPGAGTEPSGAQPCHPYGWLQEAPRRPRLLPTPGMEGLVGPGMGRTPA